MEKSLHHVADLPETDRSMVEKLVGHTLQKDDVIYIAALGVAAEPEEAQRTAAWNELESIIAETQRNAEKSGLPSEQIDALIDAECAAVRYGHSA